MAILCWSSDFVGIHWTFWSLMQLGVERCLCHPRMMWERMSTTTPSLRCWAIGNFSAAEVMMGPVVMEHSHLEPNLSMEGWQELKSVRHSLPPTRSKTASSGESSGVHTFHTFHCPKKIFIDRQLSRKFSSSHLFLSFTFSGWWFGTFLNNHPNWLSYFSEG